MIPAPLPLVAREEELRRLLDAWRRSWNGERVVVSISGEPGTGRSRLLTELARHPSLSEALVVELRTAGGGDAEVILRLSHALRFALERRGSLTALEIGTSAGSSNLDLLARELDLVARRLPLVLMVDDLGGRAQDAAELGELLQRVSAPLLLVAATDDRRSYVGALVARYCDASLIEIRIRPLDAGSASAIVRRTFGLVLPEPELRWLMERTHGIPLLLREVLGAAVESGRLGQQEDRWLLTGPLSGCEPLLCSVLPLVPSELRRLPAHVRAGLARLAVLGRTSTPRTRHAVGVSEADLAPAMAAGIIEAGTHAFTSTLFHCAAFAAALSSRLLPEIANGLRACLCAPGSAETVTLPEETVNALIASCAADQDRRDLAAALRDNGKRLVQLGDFAAAAAVLRKARPTTGGIGEDIAAFADWTETFSQALFAIGRVDEQQQVLDDFLRLHGQGESPELAPRVAAALLGKAIYHERRREIADALGWLERSEELLTRNGNERRDLVHRGLIARAQVMTSSGRRTEAIALYRRLFDEVADSDLPSLFDALLFFSLIATEPDEISEADRRSLELMQRCDHEGRTREVVQLKAARLGLLMRGEEVDRHEALARELVERVHELALPRTEANALSWLAMICSERGEDDDALRYIDKALELRYSVRSMGLWQLTLLNKIYLLTRARCDAEAVGSIQLLEEDARTYGRVYRRFLIDACRLQLAIRQGHEVTSGDIARLKCVGEEEGFPGIVPVVLAVEAEALLHAKSVARGSAEEYARRVIEAAPTGLADRFLYVTALAVLARSHEGRDAGPEDAQELLVSMRGKVLETLGVWREREAPRLIARAQDLLAAHAPRAIPAEDLATVDGGAGVQGLPAWYHCEIITFGGLKVLGPAGEERGGRHFGSSKADSKPRKMLAALVVANILGRRLKRERLIDLVWGDDVSSDATNNFHVTLSGLRRVVGDAVDFDGSTYSLNTRLARLDAERFRELAEEAASLERDGLAYRACAVLRAACSIADGDLLDGIYDEWVEGARELMRARVRNARLRLAELALQRGESDEAASIITRLLEVDSLDEEAQALHMRQLESGGERLRAMRDYERFAERLRAEYGVEPSVRLSALRLQILQRV